jgi:hypothetical protein
MVIKLVNSTDENDGWWESCRLNETTDTSDWMITTKDNKAANYGSGDMCLALNNNYVTGVKSSGLANRNIANESHYSTGRLKDLHKVKFELLPNTNEMEFTEMGYQYNLSQQDKINVTKDANLLQDVDERYDEYGGINPGTKIGFPSGNVSQVNLARGSARAKKLINDWIDPSHDMIYIRIHCRPNVSTELDPVPGFSGSKLMMQLVANHEVMFSSDKKESKYQIPGHSIPMDKETANKKRKVDASAHPLSNLDVT